MTDGDGNPATSSMYPIPANSSSGNVSGRDGMKASPSKKSNRHSRSRSRSGSPRRSSRHHSSSSRRHRRHHSRRRSRSSSYSPGYGRSRSRSPRRHSPSPYGRYSRSRSRSRSHSSRGRNHRERREHGDRNRRSYAGGGPPPFHGRPMHPPHGPFNHPPHHPPHFPRYGGPEDDFSRGDHMGHFPPPHFYNGNGMGPHRGHHHPHMGDSYNAGFRRQGNGGGGGHFPNDGRNGRRHGGGGRGRRDDGASGVSLLVRNISPDIRPEDLHKAFGKIGAVRDVYIPRDFHSQQPKGFAFVEFGDPGQAREAKNEMDNFMMKGRVLEVVFAQERRKTPNEMRGRVVDGGSDRGNPGKGPKNDRNGSFERSSRMRSNATNEHGPQDSEEGKRDTFLEDSKSSKKTSSSEEVVESQTD